MPVTIGLSKKVTWPAVALAALAVAALVLAALLGDATLVTAGVSLLAAAGVGGAVGYRAPASEVVDQAEVDEALSVEPVVGEGSDARLSREARTAAGLSTPEA